jgi:hypothetical protein
MGDSYWTNYTHIQCSFLCNEISQDLHVTGNTENCLLWLFQSSIIYRSISWGNYLHSAKIFKIKHKIIIITTDAEEENRIEIHLRMFQFYLLNHIMYYHFSYLWLTDNNSNPDDHNINTRQSITFTSLHKI